MFSTELLAQAENLLSLCRARGLKLAAAESCTGGMLSSLLVEYPGSSDYLQQSLVTYSNAAKTRMLGVPQSILDTHGAVSTETAMAMARGARMLLDADFALADLASGAPG